MPPFFFVINAMYVNWDTIFHITNEQWFKNKRDADSRKGGIKKDMLNTPQILHGINEAAIWGLWKVNCSRQIREGDQNAKFTKLAVDSPCFSLVLPSLDSEAARNSEVCTRGRRLHETPSFSKKQERGLLRVSKSRGNPLAFVSSFYSPSKPSHRQ